MSIKNYSHWLLVAMALSNVAHAQDSVKHSTLSLTAGLNRVADKDAFQSPYTYKGTNLLLTATYTRFGAKGQHIVDFTYSGGRVASIVSPKADNRLLLFNYGYLVNIRTKNSKWTPALGLGVHALLSNINYLPKIQNPKSYSSGGAYLTFRGNIDYRIGNKSSAGFQFGLPVAGLVYRPDFDVNGKTFTKATHIGEHLLFSAGMQYTRKLAPQLRFIAAWKYDYFTYDAPRPITILQNSLSIGLQKSF